MCRAVQLLFAFAGLALLGGCASETVCHNLDEFHCVQRGGPGAAIATAAAATAAWGVVGCSVNGCTPGYLRCNERTGFCERIACGEGLPGCPEPWECDFENGTCE